MTENTSSLIQALLVGDHKRAQAEAVALKTQGMSIENIVRLGIQPAMESLDNKCTVDQFNLLEIMLTGRAVAAVAKELFPEISQPPNPKATIVVASLEGDIHDIGKNILRMVLIGHRYKVIDCGKDQAVATVVAQVQAENAQALCISGLITSVIPKVRSVRAALNIAGLNHVRLMAGGAALKQSHAEALDVDYVGQTAFDGAIWLEQFWGESSYAPRFNSAKPIGSRSCRRYLPMPLF